MRRYGLVAVLVIALGVIVFIGRHPSTAVPGSGVASLTAAPEVHALLSRRLTKGVRIVSGGLYSLDAVLDASGPHLIPDVPGQIVETPAHQSVTVVGWAVDPVALRPAAGLIAVLDGTLVLSGKYGVSRPDVAKAFNKPAFAASGFSVTVTGRLLSAGRHTIQILSLSADRSTYYQAPKVITLAVGG